MRERRKWKVLPVIDTHSSSTRRELPVIPFTLYCNRYSTFEVSKIDRSANPNKHMLFLYKAEITNLESARHTVTTHDHHCIQFDGGRPSGSSFIQADCIPMDMDHGSRIEEFLAENKEWEFLLYTSSSHTEEKHRFHVLFPLGETITSLNEYKDLLAALRRVFSKACKGYRFSAPLYGNLGSQVQYNEGRSILQVLRSEVAAFKASSIHQDLEKRKEELALLGDLRRDLNSVLPFRDRRFYGLGEKAEKILHGQGVQCGYPSRSEAECAVVTICVKAGWSFPQIKELFARECVENTHFRKKGRDCYNELFNTYKKVLIRVKTRLDVKIIEDFLMTKPYTGRSKYTDMAVSETILLIVKQTGKLHHLALTQGELSMMSGLSGATVSASLKRLSSQWLIRTQTSKTVVLYDIDLGFISERVPVGLPESDDKKFNVGSLDIFTRQALGKTGKLIWEMLVNYRQGTPSQIRKQTGIGSINTVKMKLLKMEEAGIVEQKDGKWWVIIDELTEERETALAERLGVKGTIRQRERSYQTRKEVSDWNRTVFASDEIRKQMVKNSGSGSQDHATSNGVIELAEQLAG